MAKIKKAGTLMKHLEKRFEGINCFDRGESGRVYVSAEDGTEIKGMPLADYYDYPHFDPEEKTHEFGVHRVFKKWVESKGWFIEWENAGCLC